MATHQGTLVTPNKPFERPRHERPLEDQRSCAGRSTPLR